MSTATANRQAHGLSERRPSAASENAAALLTMSSAITGSVATTDRFPLSPAGDGADAQSVDIGSQGQERSLVRSLVWTGAEPPPAACSRPSLSCCVTGSNELQIRGCNNEGRSGCEGNSEYYRGCE